MVVKGYVFCESNDREHNETFLQGMCSTLIQEDAEHILDAMQGNSYLIGVDGSGKSTGVCIFGLGEHKGELTLQPRFGFILGRSDNETFIGYRVKFKMFFTWLLLNCYITRVYYEEPFMGFATAIPVLYSLRTAIEEILEEYCMQLENRTRLSYISNQSWKRLLRVVFGRDFVRYTSDQKAQIESAFRCLVAISPEVKGKVPQDLFDAFVLGAIGGASLKLDEEIKTEIVTKKEVVVVELSEEEKKKEMLDLEDLLGMDGNKSYKKQNN